MTHITCRLTAKNRDQLQNPTLSTQVWANCTFLRVYAARFDVLCCFGALNNNNNYLVAFRQELKTMLFRECFPVD